MALLLNDSSTSRHHYLQRLLVGIVLVSNVLDTLSFSESLHTTRLHDRISSFGGISSSRRRLLYLQASLIDNEITGTEDSPSSRGTISKGASHQMTSTVFGNLRRIRMPGEEGKDDGNDDNVSFVGAMGVPTFAADGDLSMASPTISIVTDVIIEDSNQQQQQPTRMRGLEGALNHGPAFVVDNVLTKEACEQIISDCESLNFGQFDCGRNHHGAMQILVSKEMCDSVSKKLAPYIAVDQIEELRQEMLRKGHNSNDKQQHPQQKDDDDVRLFFCGLNRRWRVYRYDSSGNETFTPHIDAGFPPSGLSEDGTTLLWDDSPSDREEEIVSRLTILIYLNDDFVGGETNFYRPLSQDAKLSLIASVRPVAGSVLLFPQGVGEQAVDYARKHWPLHEGSSVLSGRPKYVIRSDALFATQREKLPLNDELFQYDHFVRRTFLPKPSIVWDQRFLAYANLLYNPHMGVENLGPFLYSFLRMTKSRSVVEIGAGFTSLWILQALKDNEDEMRAVRSLQRTGQCKLMNIDWTIHPFVEEFGQERSRLLCIDNCEHQKETATGASAVALSLGLERYLEFQRGDAFDLALEAETVDILWCDFGVGSRMREFISSAWRCIRPGGFLLCHSTLTNENTRRWLESIRTRQPQDVTGIAPDQYVELSLLEPLKRYQNSVSILQKRKSMITGDSFDEPIYSTYA